MHTSYAYPSHLVVLLDVVLVAAAALAIYLRPRLGGPALGWAESWLRRLARRPARAALLIGLAGALGNALVFSVFGPPVPTVADEHSYLLAADTFASGRLANPSHPLWRHFDTPHVLQWPVCASKYPPAQGLLLALGQTFAGSPAWSLCLSAGLLAAALTWMFLAWLPAPWALLGGVLALLRLGVGSYWNQSFWGGSLAAVGGALLYGALRRLMTRPSFGQALILATGLTLLAASRPFEGLLISLPAAIVLIHRVLGWSRSAWLGVGLPIAAVLATAALAMGHYNQRLTGDPMLPPHAGYRIAYNYHPEWIFVGWNGRAFEHQEQAPSRASLDARTPNPPPPPWLGRAVRQTFDRATQTLYFVFGLAILVPIVLWAANPSRRRYAETPGSSVLVAACLLVAIGHGLTREWYPHYAAPIAGPLLVLGLQALRGLSAGRGRPLARPLAAGVAAVHALLFLIQLPAYRADDSDPGRQRARIEARLASGPERHLILVHGDGHGGGNWTANAADVDAAPVVWARDLGTPANRELLDYFSDRRIWRLDSIAPGEPQLVALARPDPVDRDR